MRLRLLDQAGRDLATLSDNAGVARARRLSVRGLEPRRVRLTRDPFVAEVEVVTGAVLQVEHPGRALTVPLGAFVKADGAWKVVTLLPSKRSSGWP